MVGGSIWGIHDVVGGGMVGDGVGTGEIVLRCGR